MKTIRTDRAREIFIRVLTETCNVSAACRQANIARSAAYAWRKDDEDFAAAWADAEAEAVDNLEGVAYERAMSGQSDRMIEVLLKGHRPERYVERRAVDHTSSDGSMTPRPAIDASKLSDETLREIIEAANAAKR